MPITLEAIKAEQTKIAEMIAAFEKQPSFPVEVNIPPTNEGEQFVGVIISADGSKRHAIILLPGDNDDANWKEQMEWAASIGGELPDRVESALLFATMKDQFKPAWYWTREKRVSVSDCAWGQDFDDGYQGCDDTDDEFRARAVRRLEIL